MFTFRRTFIFKVTGSRSKVEPGSDHDVALLDHGRNMCAKFKLLPAYGHRDLARTKWQPPPSRPARMKTIPAQHEWLKSTLIIMWQSSKC